MAARRAVCAAVQAGRPVRYTRREVVNAVLYQTRNGCVWQALSHDLPPYRICFHYFRWGWVGVKVKKLVVQKGFVVQPKRWTAERTFGWLGRSRWLSKEYERTTASSEALFIKVAMIHLMVRRLRR